MIVLWRTLKHMLLGNMGVHIRIRSEIILMGVMMDVMMLLIVPGMLEAEVKTSSVASNDKLMEKAMAKILAKTVEAEEVPGKEVVNAEVMTVATVPPTTIIRFNQHVQLLNERRICETGVVLIVGVPDICEVMQLVPLTEVICGWMKSIQLLIG